MKQLRAYDESRITLTVDDLSRLEKNRPANVKILFDTLMDKDKLTYYSEYEYELWKPPKIRLDWIHEHVSGRTLEIGCGADPLITASNAEYKMGMDISLKAAREASQKLDEVWVLDIDNTKEADLEQLAGQFNTVVQSETLEHFAFPQRGLSLSHYLLKKDGKLVVTYPNKMSVAMAVDFAVHGGKFGHFEPFHRGHISIVRKPVLEKWFAETGFSIAEQDFRESGLIAYGNTGWPRGEQWKRICSLAPSVMGHQFFYVLEKK